ncbi:Integration host factor subunit beta [Buchnera aphidicola (Neophyllaphis podocarpi)]|uniref:HU family DNA-binding protein n=1 Tax=Buchnera aphidicola TaxID=9 RepID=UPI0031B7FDC7
MVTSELCQKIAQKKNNLSIKFINLIVKKIIKIMVITLESGLPIQIRGFGSFYLKYLYPRILIDPTNLNKRLISETYVTRFRLSKKIKCILNI